MTKENYSLVKTIEEIDKRFEDGKPTFIERTGLCNPWSEKTVDDYLKKYIRIIQKHLISEKAQLYHAMDRDTFINVCNKFNHPFGLRSKYSININVIESISKIKELSKWGECKEEMIYKITGKTPESSALFAFGDEEEILEQKDTNDCKKISPRPKIYLDSKEFQEKINKRKK